MSLATLRGGLVILGLVVVGLGTAIAGVALIYPPAALIVGGLTLVAFAIFGLED